MSVRVRVQVPDFCDRDFQNDVRLAGGTDRAYYMEEEPQNNNHSGDIFLDEACTIPLGQDRFGTGRGWNHPGKYMTVLKRKTNKER